MSTLEIDSHRGTYEVCITSISALDKFDNAIAIVDSNVYRLHKELLLSKFDNIYLLNAIEEQKTLSFCCDLIQDLVDLGVKKNTTLVAVGGGITQDITSFTASILFRGVDWCFIPTTLLAQADSCIGSKTSINYNQTKNLVGSFYPPKKIWCDTAFLDTLPEDDIDSGIGEMLHYFVLEDHVQSINKDNLLPAIQESLRIKKKVIEVDEFDTHIRRLFNYGHTFGHALEVYSQYELKHGLAVTLGMDLANYISFRLGLISFKRLENLREAIAFNLPEYTVSNVSKYVSYLMKDKKNVGSSLVCVLPTDEEYFAVTELSDIEHLTEIIGDYFA